MCASTKVLRRSKADVISNLYYNYQIINVLTSMNTLKRKNVWIPFRVDIIELCIILYYNFLVDRQ